jgi:hypothetical protein
MVRIPSAVTAAATAAAAIAGLALAAAPAAATPTAVKGYSLTTFAGPLAGSSAPDSIATVGNDVFVSYGNGGSPTGAGGATSTIAKYSNHGVLLGQVTVAGHSDGLRYDAASGQLWSTQNEDASPTLVLINPKTLAATVPVPFSATPHGGGYDDVAFGAGGTFVSASNPALDPNTGPAIVSVTRTASGVTVNGSVLAGNATATVLNPGGGTTTLNLQDPDSLTFDNLGHLVLDSQSDQQLVFITNPGTAAQSNSVLNLSTSVDDTVFAGGGKARVLFSDRNSNTVYALTGNFTAGQAIAAEDSANAIGSIDLGTGNITPLVTGANSPHGEALTAAVPEPATWAMLMGGFGVVGGVLRRRRGAAVVAA